MLNQDTLLDYIRKAKQGDESAKEIIYKNNIPLIKCIINKFKGKGIEYDDLYQIASIGLLKAINNYDESFGVKFSTYSLPMIIGEIKRYIRDNGAIKVSRNIKILANKINHYIEDFFTEKNAYPTLEEIATRFNIEKEDVALAIDSAKMPVSLYEKYEDDEEGIELIDKISIGETEEKMIDKIHISNIIDKLTERERKIVILRYFKDKTQNEVAEEIGVSQVQISRIENKIIDKIRLKY